MVAHTCAKDNQHKITLSSPIAVHHGGVLHFSLVRAECVCVWVCVCVSERERDRPPIAVHHGGVLHFSLVRLCNLFIDLR